jgi:hypothetical protein
MAAYSLFTNNFGYQGCIFSTHNNFGYLGCIFSPHIIRAAYSQFTLILGTRAAYSLPANNFGYQGCIFSTHNNFGYLGCIFSTNNTLDIRAAYALLTVSGLHILNSP